MYRRDGVTCERCGRKGCWRSPCCYCRRAALDPEEEPTEYQALKERRVAAYERWVANHPRVAIDYDQALTLYGGEEEPAAAGLLASRTA
jgi:hypothetical protein